MINANEFPWIEAGYDLFALKGPDGLKIETLARKVRISKSSFYHHFVDMEIFTKRLMEHHLICATKMAAKAKTCKAIIPDYVMVLVEFKNDLFFNRQLRIHRDNLAFQLCYERAVSIVQAEYIGIWSEMLGMEYSQEVAHNILKVVTDLFYQRMTPEALSQEWILKFLDDVTVFLSDVIKGSGLQVAIKNSDY